jgi:hypothetical protein
MFRLDVLQNQWVILALVGGLGLMGLVLLMYMALWRARGRVPWILIVIWVAAVLYAVGYVTIQAQQPPNW